ncbi:two-component system, sensor histidine kinase YesM [Paenibacillus catalpae]|uniref:Two-component system, sensor histidine kinase YesM n=1 Tax=Paenibacillus catalpae TaxID=1045775 RepID=A0A1I1SXJ2_9BACL|nr:sensor histidine kinase [Paenibacillus catalpae]SFD48653.1 two-component system, sensor histidine kinase YesM [Paenibacillus catalpae]
MKSALFARTKGMKLSTILSIFIVFIVIIPITILSYVILRMYREDVISQATQGAMQSSQTVAYATNQEINKMVGIFAAISMDPEVLTTASTIHSTTSVERQANIGTMYKILGRHTSSVFADVLSIKFYFKGSGTYTYLSNIEGSDDTTREMDWYKLALTKQDHVHFLGKQQQEVHSEKLVTKMMAASFSPSAFNILSDVEVIYFLFNGSEFDNIVIQDTNQASKVYLVDEKGTIIASNQPKVKQGGGVETIGLRMPAKEGHYFEDINGVKALVTYADVGQAGWKIINIMPYSKMIANYEKVYHIILLAAMLVILSIGAVSIYFVHNVTRPIHRLMRQMSRVMEGNLSTNVYAKGSLELLTLGHTFNHMIVRINELMKQHEEQERAKRMAEFSALQSQINPHFLINTLNAIKLMALISKADNIQHMTHSLMRLLSSSFNRGGRLARLSDEVDNLKHYLYIMEIRYGNKFETVWDIEEQAEPLFVLKLLLQPIIENSLIHGLSDMEHGGVIYISASVLDHKLLVCIEDNGVGVTGQALEDYRRQTAEPLKDRTYNGMGILNVHQRIQLHYGTAYGLAIETSDKGGAKVLLTLPILRHSDEADERKIG